MSQSSHSVGNVSAPAFRTAMNASLQALASLNSGGTAPATTYANMLWYDTATNILKMRSEADDAWINVAYVDQSANAWRVLDDTQVVNTSGTQTGLLGDQATATWEAGTGTTESLVSPAKVAAAIAALATDWELVETIATTSGTTIEFPSTGTLADGYIYAVEMIEVEHNFGSLQSLMLDVYGATKAAYIGAPQKVSDDANNAGWFGFFELPTTSRVAVNNHVSNNARLMSSSSSGVDFADRYNGSETAPVFHFNTAQKIDKVRFSLETGGSFDNGNMKLWRKAL